MSFVVLAAALLVVLPFALGLARANELFVLRVDDGKVSVVRGRIPQRLLDDVADVVARPRPAGARIRAVSDGGRPRLVAEGALRPEQLQRLRNVLGLWTVAQIRRAAPPKR